MSVDESLLCTFMVRLFLLFCSVRLHITYYVVDSQACSGADGGAFCGERALVIPIGVWVY